MPESARPAVALRTYVWPLVLCVVGLASFLSLPVRELPSVDPPVVSIGTTYRGASAEVLESSRPSAPSAS